MENKYPQKKNTYYKWGSFSFFILLGASASNHQNGNIYAHIIVYATLFSLMLWFYHKGDKNGE